MTQRLPSFVGHLCWLLNGLLAFLLLFGHRVEVPLALQVVGRLHPALLHFPLVLAVGYALWALFGGGPTLPNPRNHLAGRLLLLATAFTAVLTAVAGCFLAKETGYDADALYAHQWAGAGLAFATLGWYAALDILPNALNKILALSALVLTGFTGHWGGELTHGTGFVTAPLATSRPPVPLNEATAEVYKDLIAPILHDKCTGCHNAAKAKGGLSLENPESIRRGGKHGVLWDTTAAFGGLLLERLALPLDHEHHMPPSSKPQLTDWEKKLLRAWIVRGAPFVGTIAALPSQDSLRLLAQVRLHSTTAETYHFAAAPEATVSALNSHYRAVTPIAAGSPALQASFFGSSTFKRTDLEELLPIKAQLIALNINYLPITDADLAIIKEFKQLRHLHLSFTNIKGEGLAALSTLTELRELGIAGTAVPPEALSVLAALPKLQKIYAGGNQWPINALQQVRQQLPKVHLEVSNPADTVVMALPAPAILNEDEILTQPVALQIKSYVPDVDIRYTTDGSVPDSTHSPQYAPQVMLNRTGPIKVRAFKAGWRSSEVAEAFFFTPKGKPDSIWNVRLPEPDYRHVKASALLDLKRGDKDNFRSGEWQAYRDGPMETVVYFKQPTEVSSFTLSYLLGIGSYIMPPRTVEVWGGPTLSSLRLLQRNAPTQPTRIASNARTALQLTFPSTTVRYLKVKATPVSPLPAWHPGKGDKGWVFVDEVFVN